MQDFIAGQGEHGSNGPMVKKTNVPIGSLLLRHPYALPSRKEEVRKYFAGKF